MPLLFIRRLFYWGVIVNVLFQAGLLLFTGTTFTLFFYGMTAASFAFVSWPVKPVSVAYRRGQTFAKFVKIFGLIDVDKRFVWAAYPATDSPTKTETDANGWLHLFTGDQVYSGFRALRMIILLNPVTYFAIAAAIAAAGDVAGWTALYRRLIVTASLVLLMPPLAWIADTLTGGGEVQAPVPGSLILSDSHTHLRRI